MNELRFCKDCKHYREGVSVSFYGAGFYMPERCFAIERFDLVTGGRIGADPRHSRDATSGSCGIDGKLWEAKS